MSFDLLNDEVNAGLAGRNAGIPTGFHKLDKYIGLRRRVMTMIFGPTGSGKSAFLHSTFILSPFDYVQKNRPDIKFKVILFSMERSKVYLLAKWICRKIFIEEGVLIPIPKLLGWWENDKLTKDEHDLFLKYRDYLEELLTYVDIIEGAQNPTGIYKYVRDYSRENGYFEEDGEFKKVYIPKSENEVVIIGVDHLGLTKIEKGYGTKKEAIDKLSEYLQWMRDSLGYIPTLVSQMNRNLNNPLFTKQEAVEPSIDDVKESGNPGEASDCVISIFDPIRSRTEDFSYKVKNFIDPASGANYFRSIKILKNSYGVDSLRAGVAFHGATGTFIELPHKDHMEGFDYGSLFNGTFFLENR
jgi:hypothetical protein